MMSAVPFFFLFFPYFFCSPYFLSFLSAKMSRKFWNETIEVERVHVNVRDVTSEQWIFNHVLFCWFENIYLLPLGFLFYWLVFLVFIFAAQIRVSVAMEIFSDTRIFYFISRYLLDGVNHPWIDWNSFGDRIIHDYLTPCCHLVWSNGFSIITLPSRSNNFLQLNIVLFCWITRFMSGCTRCFLQRFLM